MLFQYNVYIPELKLNTRITCFEEFIDYQEQYFKVYKFNSEYNVRKKIKLQIVNEVDRD